MTRGPLAARPALERKLVAIVHADMVGYSRFIATDDAGTSARLAALRAGVIQPELSRHAGQLVQTGGDSLLMTFQSVTGAVQFALAVQRQIRALGRSLPASARLRFRFGVDMGDVIAEGGDLHGDGVIIAVRLQTACPPGGVCVSRSVYDHVRDRLRLRFDALGPLALKNLSRPVEAFALRIEPARRRAVSRSSAAAPPEPIVQRQLAAVLVAEVVGYTRHIEKDADSTHARLLEIRRDVVDPLMAEHRGTVAKVRRDGFVSVFASVADAAGCATAIQRALARRGAGARPDERIELRMGVAVGDVTLADDEVDGACVDLAVRLQHHADPGAVVVSAPALDQLRGAGLGEVVDLGPLAVGGSDQPVPAFELRHRPEPGPPPPPPAVAVAPAPRISPRNAIAVMPFANLSGDPAEDYFADGMVEDITTELSHFSSLFVIARNSAFTYKGQARDVRRIAGELGVRYLVEGSVRRYRDRIRIAAQLIECATGAHLWAERFEGDAGDVFDLQDRVSARVVTAIEPKVLAVEIERARRKPAGSLDAYDCYLRSGPFRAGLTAQANEEALALLTRSLDLDPHYAPALAAAAMCHAARRDQGWSADPAHDVAEGLRLARAAVAAGPEDATALCLGGHTIAALSGDFALGAALLDRAVRLNANYADGWMRSSMVRVYVGDFDGAIVHAERAMALSPQDPRMYMSLSAQGFAWLFQGQFAEALRAAERALQTQQRPEMAHRIRIAALSALGRVDEMRTAGRALMEQIPSFRILRWRARSPFNRDGRFDMMQKALQEAGLPD
mgnify:FL=1